jgi:hypothetical protein
MNWRRTLGVALCALVAMAPVGCGGGSSSNKASTKPAVTRFETTPAAPPAASPAPAPAPAPAPTPAPAPVPALTHARYVKRADGICLAARRRLIPAHAKPVAAPGSGSSGVIYKRYATAARQTASIDGTILGQVRTLAPPPADQGQVDRLNALLAQLGGTARQVSAAAAAQDAARVTRLSASLATAAGRYQSAASAYGLHVCGQTASATLYRRGNR